MEWFQLNKSVSYFGSCVHKKLQLQCYNKILASTILVQKKHITLCIKNFFPAVCYHPVTYKFVAVVDSTIECASHIITLLIIYQLI